MEKFSKINPFMSELEMEISDELDRLVHEQLEKVKIYLTTATLKEITNSRNYSSLDKTLYGVKVEECKNLMTLKRPPLVRRNGGYAIS